MKKALLVTRVSGFIPQFESADVKILQKMGYEVHYAANFETIVYGIDNDRVKELNMIEHHIPFARKLCTKVNWYAYKELLALMKKERFDLVHCHMPLTGVLARRAAKKTRTAPVLYTGHGFHFYQGAPMKNWIFYPVERWMARYTDGLITINEEDFERAKHFPTRGMVYRIHGVGIDCQRFEQDGEVMRCRMSEDKKLHLITVGELAPGKNHQAILRAMPDMPYAEYDICGEGQCLEELRLLAKNLQIEDRVHFLGYQPDIPRRLHEADIFVFPSLREGMPVAMMEAMAAGLSVLALNIRGCRELIDHGKGGYLLDSDHPELIKEALHSMAAGKSMRKQMGTYNQRKIKQYSRERVNGEREKIYKDVLGRRKKAVSKVKKNYI